MSNPFKKGDWVIFVGGDADVKSEWETRFGIDLDKPIQIAANDPDWVRVKTKGYHEPTAGLAYRSFRACGPPHDFLNEIAASEYEQAMTGSEILDQLNGGLHP